MKKVGIVGYGHLGKFLVEKILNNPNFFKLVFVWNRSKINDPIFDKDLILNDLNEFVNYQVDLIIEIAHPIITEMYGPLFLKYADYVVGSPTALANKALFDELVESANKFNRKIYVPCGAFWGASDIKKMADRNTLKGLRITMKKHPDSLKLEGKINEILIAKKEQLIINNEALILYDGPVRNLCKQAPNNVNTIAVGALVAHNLGFDFVEGCLVADPSLTDRHLIEIEVIGPFNQSLNQSFKCTTIRSNPAQIGHVTGNQTYESFFNSLLETIEELFDKPGIKVC